MLRSPVTLWALLLFQAACTAFFVFDAMTDAVGGQSVQDGPFAQAVEYAVSAGLAVGLGVTAMALRHVMASHARLQQQVAVASGAFETVLQEHFAQWGLTPSEEDVARLAIKGLSVADMAALRGSKDGTIKAQSAAVYRKAGVSGHLQLLSLFIEELMADPILTDSQGGS